MTKAGLLYHDIRHLLKNKDAHIMVNDSRSPIPQAKDKKKGYINHNIKIAYCESQFQHITGQPIKWILHAVNNIIRKNLPILQEDVVMSEDIYVPSITHVKCKTVWHKIQHFYPVNIPSFTKTILDKAQVGHHFLWPHAFRWNRFPQHHITEHHVCHRNYDQKPKN